MMSHKKHIISYMLLLFGIIASAQTSLGGDSLTKNLDELMSWFPGEYDNHQQVYREAIDNMPNDMRHRQTHHIFHAVQIEDLPGRLIYAQQSQHYDLTDIYRQRIYSFSINHAEQAIQLTIYTPKNPASLVDGHIDESVFMGLTDEDFYLKPGCEVYWKKDNGVYEGYLKKGACNYYSERFKTRVYLNETLTLSKDALLLDDRATDEFGSLVFGVDDKGPTINLKEKPCK